MRTGLALALMLIVPAGSLLADEASQTDWSGGGGVVGPVTDWGSTFESATATSWASIPGQLALSSTPLASPIEHRIASGFDRALSVQTADVDDDGDSDIIGTAYGTNDVVLWYNDGGDPVQWTSQTVDGDFGGGGETFAADVDGDGNTDLLGAGFTAGIAWWRNDGGEPISWNRMVITDDFAGGHDVWGGDLDGDGDTDVVGVAAEDDEVAWWRNDGGNPISWVKQTIDGTADYPCRVDAKDIDGDGILDVAATSWNDAEVAWWRNDGADPIGWTKQVIRSGYTGTHGLHVCDVDRDGDNDVLGAAMNVSDVTWWRNCGGDPIVWEEHVIDGNFTGAGYVYPHDIDGDGDVDVAASAWGTGGIAWWENTNGVGTSWTKHQLITGVGQTSCAYADDVDGDGDIDVLGTGFDADFLSWWEVTEFVTSGELTGSILDTGTDPHAAHLDWTADQPAGTAVRFKIRTSFDAAEMGPWSDDITEPCDLPASLGRYVQYRAVLETTDSGASPLLKDLTLSWEQLDGCGCEPSERRVSLDQCSPNPARGTADVSLSIPGRCAVCVDVLSLRGHHIATALDAELPAGNHRVRLPLTGLSPGMYVCRARAADCTVTQRVVVVE
jgi:hypothetical protein